MSPAPGSLEFVIASLNRFTERKVKQITLDAVANLVEDTPRKTGWARANWVPKIGSDANPDGAPPSEDAASGAVGARAAQRDSGILTIATTYTLPMGRIFITNNVPYIRRLNEGWSKQAPAGFVQSSILRAVLAAVTP